jgi:hypothetical protein
MWDDSKVDNSQRSLLLNQEAREIRGVPVVAANRLSRTERRRTYSSRRLLWVFMES